MAGSTSGWPGPSLETSSLISTLFYGLPSCILPMWTLSNLMSQGFPSLFPYISFKFSGISVQDNYMFQTIFLYNIRVEVSLTPYEFLFVQVKV